MTRPADRVFGVTMAINGHPAASAAWVAASAKASGMAASLTITHATQSSPAGGGAGSRASTHLLSPRLSSVGALPQHHQHFSFADRLGLLAADLRHLAVLGGLHRHLHLHALEDHQHVAGLHLVAHLL